MPVRSFEVGSGEVVQVRSTFGPVHVRSGDVRQLRLVHLMFGQLRPVEVRSIEVGSGEVCSVR